MPNRAKTPSEHTGAHIGVCSGAHIGVCSGAHIGGRSGVRSGAYIGVRGGMRIAACIGAFVALSLGTEAVAASGPVPPALQGRWVPRQAACSSPLHLQIAADHVMLVNGHDRQPIGRIEMAGPGYFPPGYHGIMAVLITEFSGQQPLTATFNVGEKRGVAQVEFAPPMAGKATPQLTAYNRRIASLNLARRFALDKALLKRCPA